MLSWFLLSGVALALVGYMTRTAQRLSWPRRQPPPILPAQAGLTSEVVRFRARGEVLTIAAWHIPAPGAAQAVIIAYDGGEWQGHAFAINARDLAAHLIRTGVTVLMLDLRDPSERGTTRLTYGSRERRDLLGAVDWLLEQGYAPGSIGVLGASIGAVAAIDAANRERAIGALMIDSACANVLAMMPRHFRSLSKLPLCFLPDGRLLKDQARQRPAELLRVIDRRPVLIIHAKGDQFVPVERSRALAHAGDRELWVADCANHLGAFGANLQACHQQVTWFFVVRSPADRLHMLRMPIF
ncbi:MAG TPA: prolyl oligopeptidase family serine peptidase [Roseiflexaceae bacterium]|nr:prolyl oligopeptidase family serine peptidase [Roseiflexaceae bacterium]